MKLVTPETIIRALEEGLPQSHAWNMVAPATRVAVWQDIYQIVTAPHATPRKVDQEDAHIAAVLTHAQTFFGLTRNQVVDPTLARMAKATNVRWAVAAVLRNVLHVSREAVASLLAVTPEVLSVSMAQKRDTLLADEKYSQFAAYVAEHEGSSYRSLYPPKGARWSKDAA